MEKKELINACSDNNLEMVKILLENGAKESVNKPDKYDNTPLSWACFYNNLEMMKILLENGAQESVNVKDAWNQTPLFWACIRNNFEMVKILLENGADIFLGKNLLKYFRYELEIIKLLEKYKEVKK